MKRVYIYSLLLLVLSASCGKRVITGGGSTTSEDRALDNFTSIDISAPVNANIHVKSGAQTSVKLSGYRNLIDEINTELDGNTLKITSRDFIDFDSDRSVEADITVGSLVELGIHGAADATVNGLVTGTDFRLKISGAGDVSIEKIEVKNITATISGAGDADIKEGSANNASFKISGAGDIKSYGLQANNVTAKVSGAGSMQVTARSTLDAKVSGAGSIHYKGQPSLTSETSGIGEIAAAD